MDKKRLWGKGIIFFFAAIGMATLIAEGQWLWLGIFAVPLLVYFAMEKPFIFPFGVYLFFLPFDQISTLSALGGTTITKYLGIFSILSLILKGSFERKLKAPHKTVIATSLMAVFCVCSYIWAIDPSAVAMRFSTIFGLYFLYLVLASYRIKGTEFRTCKWFIILGGFIASVFALYEHSIGIDYMPTVNRATLSFGEEATDPNILSFSLLIPLAAALDDLLNARSKRLRALLLLIFGVTLVAIFVSGSRGGMIGVFIIFAVNLLFVRKRVTLLSVVLFAGIAVFSFVPHDFLSDRWESAAETGGAGRTYIWLAGLRAFPKYWAIGAGLNNFPYVYRDFGRFTPQTTLIMRGAHNQFLEIAVELGIIGLSLFLFAMWKHYRLLNASGDDGDPGRAMLKASFFSLLATSFFLGTLWTKTYWLLLMLILMNHSSSVEGMQNRYRTI